MKPVIRCLMGTLLLVATVAPLAAQDRPAPEPAQPLQVQIVIARYQNDKRVSSLPFSLSTSTSPASKANVRMGGQVAVPSAGFAATQGDASAPKPMVTYQYRDVGTNIDLTTLGSAGGRFGLNITISETTLKPATELGGTGATPGVNTYQSQNTVYVKDGEAAQFTAATDRLTGEVVRIEVTAKVVK